MCLTKGTESSGLAPALQVRWLHMDRTYPEESLEHTAVNTRSVGARLIESPPRLGALSESRTAYTAEVRSNWINPGVNLQ